MRLPAVFALLAMLALVLPGRRAHASAPAVVRGFFAALERKDFGRALALTEGAAKARTANLVGTLHRAAQQHHAELEFRVKRLDVDQPYASAVGATPVRVHFDIDVIGKRWIFRKVARKLTGRANFYVAANQIVAIHGKLD
jgi:hypothetical protein